jgi:hypothetical protein
LVRYIYKYGQVNPVSEDDKNVLLILFSCIFLNKPYLCKN